MSEVNARAAELFAAGESIKAVAEKLFNGGWMKAKKMHNAWLVETGGAAPEAKPKKRGKEARVKAAQAEEPEAENRELGDYGINVDVPEDRLGDVLATFEADEQAYAVQAVMQRRMDLLLEG